MAVLLTFWVLVGWTVRRDRLQSLRTKSRQDWLLDGVGLAVQGLVIPLLQVTLMVRLYGWLLPGDRAVLSVTPGVGFLLSFVGVDYLYYWNHRLLHSRWLWRIHAVHHTVTEMDVWGTSRNTVWTSVFLVYLWVHGLFLYGLQDGGGYAVGVSLTAMLDLWRHSGCSVSSRGGWSGVLSSWLILPQDHAWHHARGAGNCNFGANLKVWDRLHGTEGGGDRFPDRLGVSSDLSVWRKLFYPFP